VAVDDHHVWWVWALSSLHSPPSYWVARANLDGSGLDESFIRGNGGGGPTNLCGVAVDTLSVPPSNEFSFGSVRRKPRGNAKLTVIVADPGEVELAGNNKVKGAETQAHAAGDIELTVRPKRRAKRRLNRHGRASVAARVTFTPTDGTPNTESKRIKLIKR
jgi:hypothetical protein